MATRKATNSRSGRAAQPCVPTRAPKSGQIARTKAAVLETTTDLLGEIGYSRLTIDMISETSGVSRSTIYRYWTSLPELVSAAFDRALGPNPEMPDIGDIREQLIELMSQMPRILERSIWGRVLPAMIAATNDDHEFRGRLYAIADQRRDGIRTMIRRAIARGELVADTDVEWMIDMLSGIFYHRRLITGTSMRAKGMVELTVDTVLAQVRTRH